jgi:hypothetical protein
VGGGAADAAPRGAHSPRHGHPDGEVRSLAWHMSSICALYYIFKIHRDVKGFAFILTSVWRWLLKQCTAIVETMLPF